MYVTAVVDIACAVFMCALLARILSQRAENKNKWETAYCILSLFMLVNDALAYTLTGPEYPVWLRYAFAFLSMHGVGIIILVYTCYTESLIKEKTNLRPEWFVALKAAELVWLAASVTESIARRMITFPDGVLNIEYTFPAYVDITELVLLFTVPVFAIANRRKIGTRLAVLFSIFAFGPILATILFSFAEIDLSYALGAFTFVLMDLLIQEQLVREAEERLVDAYGRISDQQNQLQAALDAANTEARRVKMINTILDSGNWIYETDAADNVVSALYGDIINNKVDAVSDENPMQWIELVHPEDRDRVLAGFTAAITDHSGNTVYDETFRIADRDGNYRWSRSVGEVVRRADGTGEYIGMSMEMTRQMEEQQRQLLGAVPVSSDILSKENIGMWAFELDEGQPPRMYHDEAMLRLVGLDHQIPPEEAYHAWYDHIDEGSYQLVNDAVARMMAGEHAEVQYPWHYPDGRTIIVRCGGVRNFEYTKGIRVEGTHQNVTEVLHFDDAERRALAENNTRFFALEDDFMSLYDVDLETGHYVSYDRDDFYRRNVSDNVVSQTEFFTDLRTNVERVVYEDDRDAVYEVQTRENIISALSESDHIDHYYRIITENGPMWLKMRIVYKDAEKKNVIVGIFNAEEEMAARQQEERFRAELEQTNARLFALEDSFESLYDVELESGHYDVFVKGEFFKNNVLDRLSVPHDYFEELRDNIDAVIYEEDRDGLYHTLTRESIRQELSDTDRFDYFYRINSAESPVWLKIRIVYKDEEKKNIIIGVFNAEKDVEAQQLQEAYDEASKARDAADAANSAKTNFLFNMSHDIRTPMNAIRGFTAMAKKNADDPEKVNGYLDKIDMSGQQLLSLINQVLEMARIESGRMELEEKPVNVSSEFSSMVTVLSEQAETNGLKFIHSLGNIEHNNILADKSRMSSVTLNIVGNAMKYTPEGGTVEFSLKEIPAGEPGYAAFVFTVADTGIGMSKEFLNELYDPFSREQNSTVSRIQGTGLGLSIVKSTVDLMGGTIDVQSESGKGTRFDITVSFRIDENESAETGENDSDILGSFAGRRALLVEDNEMNREIAKDLFEEQGVIVEEAEDGDVAVAMVQAACERGEYGYYDFILMDVQMPHMNGYDATRAIRAIPAPEGVHIPIIAMTANAFEEDRQNALASGMDEHLAKPIEVDKAFITIARFLK